MAGFLSAELCHPGLGGWSSAGLEVYGKEKFEESLNGKSHTWGVQTEITDWSTEKVLKFSAPSAAPTVEQGVLSLASLDFASIATT
jgi:hypothetical protein